MQKQVFKEALEYFKKSGECCANGPDNRSIIGFIDNLYKLGAVKIEVALYVYLSDEEDFIEGVTPLYFDAEIFLYFESDMIHADAMIDIVKMRPDEIYYSKNGSIRLWWD